MYLSGIVHSKRRIKITRYFILAITVIVVAVPQGLPLSVTISLAYSVNKMLDDKNLVRKLTACQTMGNANNICSDKTGTLTTNKMTVTAFYNHQLITVQSQHSKIADFLNDQYKQLLIWSIAINSTAILRPQKRGSSVQQGMLSFIQFQGANYQEKRNQSKIYQVLPFSSLRKRMTIFSDFRKQSTLSTKGAPDILVKCCTKWFNSKDNKIEDFTQDVAKKLNQNIKEMASKGLRTIAYAFNNKPEKSWIPQQNGIAPVQQGDLIFLGLFGLRDVARGQVKQAIAKCKKAGITVRMVTGDLAQTAKSIAKDVGIIQENNNNKEAVIQGSKFSKQIGGIVCQKCKTVQCNCPVKQRVEVVKNMNQFNRIVQNLYVMARSRPQDKYALIVGLKQRGDIVAVTGDGTNDAPALKKADVGFAMGICGTQVARNSSDIVILDDNFNSIVQAVKWGRNIYDSIRKFIQFQLTVNLSAVSITLISSALFKQQVLSAVQMLWVNLIMDTLAALALATQPPSQQWLQRKPQSRSQHIVNPIMLKHIIGQGIFQIIVVILFSFYAPYFIPQVKDPSFQSQIRRKMIQEFPQNTYGPHYCPRFLQGNCDLGTIASGNFRTISGQLNYEPIYQASLVYSRHFTCLFNAFVWLQIFNFFNSRKIRDQKNIFQNFCNNWLFIMIVSSIIILQILITTFLGTFFKLYPGGLTLVQWTICVGTGFIGLPLSLILKLISTRQIWKQPQQQVK